MLDPREHSEPRSLFFWLPFMVIVCGFSLKTGALRRGKPLPRCSQPAAFRGGSSEAPRRRRSGRAALRQLPVHARPRAGGAWGSTWRRTGAWGPWGDGVEVAPGVQGTRVAVLALCQPGCTGREWESRGQVAALPGLGGR